jgi:hypothetical protein
MSAVPLLLMATYAHLPSGVEASWFGTPVVATTATTSSFDVSRNFTAFSDSTVMYIRRWSGESARPCGCMPTLISRTTSRKSRSITLKLSPDVFAT